MHLIAHVSSTKSRLPNVNNYSIINVVFKVFQLFLPAASYLNCFAWPLTFPTHILSYLLELVLPFGLHIHPSCSQTRQSFYYQNRSILLNQCLFSFTPISLILYGPFSSKRFPLLPPSAIILS